MFRRHAVPAVLSLCAACGVPAFAAPPLERAIPGDCFIVATVRDVPGLLQRGGNLSFMKAAADPAMQPFVSAVKKEFRDLSAKASAAYGFEPDRIAGLVKGQLIFAGRLTGKENPADRVEGYVLADVTGNEAAVKSMLDQAAAKAQNDGKATRKNHGDVVEMVFAKTPDGQEDKVCYAVKGGVFVGCDTPEQVARVFRGLSGGLPNSLAESAKVRRCREQFAKQAKGLGDVELFLDLPALTAAFRPAGAAEPAAGSSGGEFGEIAASATLAKGEFESLVQVAVNPKGGKLGAEMLTTPTKTLRVEPWAPDNASMYVTSNIDVERIYNNLVAQYERVLPGGIANLEQSLSEFPNKANPLVTSIKKDVVDPLGNRVTVVVDSSGAEGAKVQRFVLAWQLRNSDQIAKLFEGLNTQFGQQLGVTKKTVQGVPVYTIPPLVQQRGGRRGASPVSLLSALQNVAITREHLMVASHVELLDRVLNFVGQSGLAESPAMSRVASKFPPEPSSTLFIRAEDVGQGVYSLIKGGFLGGLVDGFSRSTPAAGAVVKPLTAALKGDRLPPYEQIRKYFRFPAGGYLVADESGLRIAFYTIR